MNTLPAGVRVRIVTTTGHLLHTFERAISEEAQRWQSRPVDLSEACSGDPDDVDAYRRSRAETAPQVWRLITPMSARQKAKLPPLVSETTRIAALDPAAQCDAAIALVRQHKHRERITARTIGAETDDRYLLGGSLPPIEKTRLWQILDGFARVGCTEVDAEALRKLVTVRGR